MSRVLPACVRRAHYGRRAERCSSWRRRSLSCSRPRSPPPTRTQRCRPCPPPRTTRAIRHPRPRPRRATRAPSAFTFTSTGRASSRDRRRRPLDDGAHRAVRRRDRSGRLVPRRVTRARVGAVHARRRHEPRSARHRSPCFVVGWVDFGVGSATARIGLSIALLAGFRLRQRVLLAPPRRDRARHRAGSR